MKKRLKQTVTRSFFQVGDRLYVFIPEEKRRMTVRAFLAKRDNYFCYDCIFCSRCSEYKGQSPFGERCYTTIFEVESEKYE